jgi:uncharacterized short protein YbdD (DUF466 family)
MARGWRATRAAFRAFWGGLRQWCGDADYERYLRVLGRRASAIQISREQFYLEQLNRRYSRPNRCC